MASSGAEYSPCAPSHLLTQSVSIALFIFQVHSEKPRDWQGKCWDVWAPEYPNHPNELGPLPGSPPQHLSLRDVM